MTMILKRWIVCLMALANLFSFGAAQQWDDSSVGYDFPRISAELQSAGTTRIMSFNIRMADVNGVPMEDRVGIVARQIKEIMADSFGVQEATAQWMKSLRVLLPLYAWVGVERDNGASPLKGGESCPIFYLRTKFRLLDSGNFWLSETPEVPSYGPGADCKRICTWVKLQNRWTGETFFHINTHFDHVSEAARAAGAEIVMRFIEKTCAGFPVVFTADMNAPEHETAYQIMTASLKDARLCAADSVSFSSYHGGRPRQDAVNGNIDDILCSDDIDVSAFRTVTKGVDNRLVSDHFPIYADLKLPGGNNLSLLGLS